MPGVVAVLYAAALLAVMCEPARAQAQPPESSVILKVYETQAEKATQAGGASLKIDLTGFRRPDMVGYIYEDRFFLVPAAGLDNMRYFAQAVAHLTKNCPDLNLESAKYEVLPYIFSGATDLFTRFQQGKLTQSEILQAGWLAVLGMSQQSACSYDPMGSTSIETAQENCNEAGRDSATIGVLPSFDAIYDMTLLLGRHSCTSPEARRFAYQLIAFGRTSSSRMIFTERMPAPDSPEGMAYSDIFENCTRTSIDDRDRAWCACYTRTLHSLKPPGAMLQALARNPFVDGTSYITGVAAALPGGAAFYQCVKETGHSKWREAAAPRPTACIMGEQSGAGGRKVCSYRAAWGEFSITADKCEPEISSRLWGYREVDCAKGGTIAAALTGPRVWKDHIFNFIDYESAVAPGFVPPMPEDATSKVPLQIRLMQNKASGLLWRMTLSGLSRPALTDMGMDDEFVDGPGRDDIRIIFQERPLVLTCLYRGDGYVSSLSFWFGSAPKHVQGGNVAPAAKERLTSVKAAATCPAQLQ